MTPEELNQIVDQHQEWLKNNKVGKRADFSDKNLTGAFFFKRNLRAANFQRANLYSAVFYCTDLRKANFYGADLSEAYLAFSKFYLANVRNVNFWKADVTLTKIANKKGIWWGDSKQYPVWQELFNMGNYDLADKVFQSFLQEK